MTLYAGAGVALAAGLVLGAAMRPDLVADDRPAGPQILPDASAARSSGPFDDGVSYAGFAGEPPDYVLGTDWKKAQEAVVAATRTAEREALTAMDAGDAAPDPPAIDDASTFAADYGVDADAREAASADVDADAAKADAANATAHARDTSAQAVHLEAEAPPEATGDTRPAS